MTKPLIEHISPLELPSPLLKTHEHPSSTRAHAHHPGGGYYNGLESIASPGSSSTGHTALQKGCQLATSVSTLLVGQNTVGIESKAGPTTLSPDQYHTCDQNSLSGGVSTRTTQNFIPTLLQREVTVQHSHGRN